MDLSNPKTTKELLKKYQTKASRGLGQNFLVHAPSLQKIAEAAELNSTETVLEIGPGLGTLTQTLARQAKQVIAIEKDLGMVHILKETLVDFKNIKVIEGDILKMNFQFSISNLQSNSNIQLSKKYKIVANIPYYLTSPLIRMFLETENPPDCMVLMVQKEVAQRICAKPPHMSILAVSVQFYADAKIVATVTNDKFLPAPKVDSAIIKITPHNKETRLRQGFGEVKPELFFEIVKAGFSHPRKQLGGNLTSAIKEGHLRQGSGEPKEVGEWLSQNSIKPQQRAETLSLEDWINLTKSY